MPTMEVVRNWEREWCEAQTSYMTLLGLNLLQVKMFVETKGQQQHDFLKIGLLLGHQPWIMWGDDTFTELWLFSDYCLIQRVPIQGLMDRLFGKLCHVAAIRYHPRNMCFNINP